MTDVLERVNITPNGDKVTILTGEIDVFHLKGFNLQLQSLQSVLDLIERKGSLEASVVFYNDSNIQVILDDTITDRTTDTAIYQYSNSLAFTDWQRKFGQALQQKDLIDFLRTHPEDVMGGVDTLISAVSKLKITTEIVGDYQYDDNNNITFMFKSKDGEGTAKIPATITLCIPMFNESDFIPAMEIELTLNKPKSETEKPTIVLTCPKLAFYRKSAVDFEVNKLKEALPGYLIMAGSPK